MSQGHKNSSSLFTIYFDQTIKGTVQDDIRDGILQQLEDQGINADAAPTEVPSYTKECPDVSALTFVLGGMRSQHQTRARELNSLNAMFAEQVVKACRNINSSLTDSVRFESTKQFQRADRNQHYFTRDHDSADIA